MTAVHRRISPVLTVLPFLAAFFLHGGETLGAASGAGPETILRPEPGSAVVCVAVAVPTGSALETPETRGVSHFLEHLLFDGSERFTRRDISDWTDRTGAFLNAFTRKETAVYFLLVDRAYAEEGIEILSQMLLHSIFPPDEVEKERKVILEEIRQAADDSGEEREGFVERYLYRGSDLAGPIMGYPATIEAMTRERIIGHYNSHYSPRRMKVFVFGGFDEARMEGWIGDYFGAGHRRGAGEPAAGEGGRAMAKKKEGAGGREPGFAAAEPRWSGEVTARPSDRLAPGLDILVPVPGPGEKGFPAMLILEEMLGGVGSPLPAILKGSGFAAARASLEVHAGFSALRFHFDCEGPGPGRPEAVTAALEALSSWKPSPGEVEAAKTAFLSSEALNREKIHLYIMAAGERLAYSGGLYLDESMSGVRKVGAEDLGKVLAAVFSTALFNAVQIAPVSSGPAGPGASDEPSSMTLGNGCRVAASTRAGSEVGALHILISGRNCVETDFRKGMTVILHAVLENSGDGVALTSKLRGMGASLQWGDNPYIPMDDYMLNEAWAFCRLEAPAERMIEAAGLLAGHLAGSAMTGEDIQAAAAALGRELGARSGSSSGILSGEIAKRLFAGHPFSAPIFPGMEGLEGITPGELEAFREAALCGANLIVTAVSPEPEEAVIRGLAALFGGFPAGRTAKCPPVSVPVVPGIYEGSIDKQGVSLGAGWRISDPSPEEAASLMIASEVLSRRMQLQIREVEGLAYSTGSSAGLYPGAVAVTATMTTRAGNLEAASAALEAEISRLSAEPPSPAEIEIARNRLLSKWARRELSSINQASAMGLDILLRGGLNGERIARMATHGDVENVISDNLKASNAVIIRLIPTAGATEKKSVPPGMMR
ncbi:MAG: insulinase family protein [Candidatus Krumholzibacteria bacterium]|jgi:predicted Zn-dependent peptidase|nr:insulinase family protein [Candidatus Krumholzibacteria bacterium]